MLEAIGIVGGIVAAAALGWQGNYPAMLWALVAAAWAADALAAHALRARSVK